LTWLPPRSGQRLESGDHVEKFLVDATLTQTVECATEILQQLVDVFVGAFHCCQAARIFARQWFGAIPVRAVVFGSDQGLVGQFNDVIADYAIKTLAALPGKPKVWAVASASVGLFGSTTESPGWLSRRHAPNPSSTVR
jgi:hypothetical protein